MHTRTSVGSAADPILGGGAAAVPKPDRKGIAIEIITAIANDDAELVVVRVLY